MVLYVAFSMERLMVFLVLSGFTNLGLVFAELGASLPETAWFYFALAQFPIYLLPALLKPLARRFPRRAETP
jgi:BASS family bile acid:Na+ symporter